MGVHGHGLNRLTNGQRGMRVWYVGVSIILHGHILEIHQILLNQMTDHVHADALSTSNVQADEQIHVRCRRNCILVQLCSVNYL